MNIKETFLTVLSPFLALGILFLLAAVLLGKAIWERKLSDDSFRSL